MVYDSSIGSLRLSLFQKVRIRNVLVIIEIKTADKPYRTFVTAQLVRCPTMCE